MWVRGIVLLLAALTSIATAVLVTPATRDAEPLVRSGRGFVDERQCGQCHYEIEQSFAAAPHSRTLRPATDPTLQQRFLGQDVQRLKDRFQFSVRDGQLWLASDHFPEAFRMDWIFGSGQHALTPIGLVTGPTGGTELIQSHISWFRDGALDLTPGSEQLEPSSPSLGLHHSSAETLLCFDCHASHVPTQQGRIDLANLKPGLSCGRCHFDSPAHVASEGDVPPVPNWRELTPRESIRRCGECHRRADEFAAAELSPNSKRLVRFAPVGLELSACFQQQHTTSQRLDCTTCHDPHAQARSDPAYYIRRCQACHDPSQSTTALCSDQPPDSQCLSCHMPTVEQVDHLRFTDHWIRVR